MTNLRGQMLTLQPANTYRYWLWKGCGIWILYLHVFLITLRAVSHFLLTHIFTEGFRGEKTALGLSPAASYDHDADSLPVTEYTYRTCDLFPYAQTHGLWQTDEQHSFIFPYTFLLLDRDTHSSKLLGWFADVNYHHISPPNLFLRLLFFRPITDNVFTGEFISGDTWCICNDHAD